MRSIALKVNVPKHDQESINKLLKQAGYTPQRRKYHCTLGFIEKIIPEEEALSFGEQLKHELQKSIDLHPLIYEVGSAAHLFGHVIVFLPTLPSSDQLKKTNLWLSQKVNEISEGRFYLNQESNPYNYIPHMTLWRTHHIDGRFKKLEKLVKTHSSYSLVKASYVVF